MLHEEAIGEARSVGEEVTHLHRPQRLAGLIIVQRTFDPHFRIRKFRDVVMHGMIEPQLRFLKQHHCGNRRDRLGHGIDAEDRVRPDRISAAKFIPPAIGFMHDLPVTGDERRHTGQLAGIEIVVGEEFRNPVQPLFIEPDIGRFDPVFIWCHMRV